MSGQSTEAETSETTKSVMTAAGTTQTATGSEVSTLKDNDTTKLVMPTSDESQQQYNATDMQTQETVTQADNGAPQNCNLISIFQILEMYFCLFMYLCNVQ